MILLKDVDLVKFVKEVYNLSRPVGMGHLHYEAGELTDEQAQSLIDMEDASAVVSMDYVKGRQCKMTVFTGKDGPFISDVWFDHSAEDLKELLNRVGYES